MNRQTIIVVIKAGDKISYPPVLDDVETYGNLKKACEAKDWKYNTISRKKLPVFHEGHLIYRTKFQ